MSTQRPTKNQPTAAASQRKKPGTGPPSPPVHDVRATTEDQEDETGHQGRPRAAASVGTTALSRLERSGIVTDRGLGCDRPTR